eukprot:jgi/Botrbrau1/830/Bobra.0352s0027.1
MDQITSISWPGDCALEHPLGVQPWGNFLMSGNALNRRDAGLGLLSKLTDELLLQVFGNLRAIDLSALSQASKSLYCYANHEELWRTLVFEEFEGSFCYRSDWRRTYITTKWPWAQVSNGPPLSVQGIFSDLLYQPWLCATTPLLPSWLAVDNLERRSQISLTEFREQFERPNRPVILSNAVGSWTAVQKWTIPYLQEVFRGKTVVAGNYDMSFDTYIQYMRANKDEMPLYLFDKDFLKKSPELAADYQVPPVFEEDLFSVLGEERRPDYRWLILGPPRSGSSFHKDPNNTSAWNAVLWGSKKWILFPPHVIPPGVHPSPDGADVATPVSIIEWLLSFYEHCAEGPVKPLEGIVRAGECLFVPRGWWHLALNLEETLAITQNFVSSVNLPHVLEFLKEGGTAHVSGCPHSRRDRLYTDFVEALGRHRPEVLQAMKEEQENKAKKGALASLFDGASNRGPRVQGDSTLGRHTLGDAQRAGEGTTSGSHINDSSPQEKGLSFAFGFRQAPSQSKEVGKEHLERLEKRKARKRKKPRPVSPCATANDDVQHESDMACLSEDGACHGDGGAGGDGAPCGLASGQGSGRTQGKKRRPETAALAFQNAGTVH